METNPHAWVESLRRSHDRLADIVDDLGPGGVEAQSYCTDWSIAQVMSHIGTGSEMFGFMVEAALTGGDAPGRETMEPIWASWNERSPQRQAEDGLSATRGSSRASRR